MTVLTARFETLWDELVRRFVRYHEMDRDPATVVELATARAELDDIRAEMARERLVIAIASSRPPRRLPDPRRRPVMSDDAIARFDADPDDVARSFVQRAVQSY